MRLLFAATLALPLTAACSDHPSADSQLVANVASPQAIDDETVRNALCFAGPATPSDAVKTLETHQKKAQTAKVERAQALVEAGKSWVAHARDASDPGAYMHADACAQLALDIDPRHGGAKTLRLLVMLNDHRFEEAKTLAETIVKERPEDHSAWGSLSDALLELGDIAGATEAAQKMVDLKPNLPSYARASYLAWLQNDPIAAKIYIQQAHGAGRGQALREPQAWVLTEAAQLFWHEGDLKGAEAGFDLALKRQPGYPDALAGKGRIALARNDLATAIPLLEESFARKEAVKTAWWLTKAYAQAGDKQRAAQTDALIRKMGRSQDPQTLGMYLATTSRDAADLTLAVSLLKIEFEARQGPYTRTAYAFALAKAGKAQEAQEVIDPVVAMKTPDAELLARLAIIRAANNQAKESKALEARARALNPHAAASVSL